MDHYFVAILLFLALFAVFDLFVGVSNDAVNFLNSAIGSRVASFKTVMVIASVGVLIGATFSSGMMEIARSGVFNPEMFTFYDVIVIFFAVMVADVLLLNVFNSLGLPTSTTVSIVFELLGGAVAAACLKIWRSGESFLTLGSYINSEKAFGIVSGILISVVVAFSAGVVIQYGVRLLFTFKYEKMYRRFGGLFGGIALTSIFYFLVMKGMKGASFMRKEYLDVMNANLPFLLISLFLVLSILFQVLILAFNANIFRTVILAGTFSLAFAFAGNDLVNFVGVPLAAYESFLQYQASGQSAELFTMGGLRNAVQTPTAFLLLSGLIMIFTLWFSKKAHRVVQTSINLSSSSRGEKEQFGSSLPGRLIVRAAFNFGHVLRQVVPGAVFSAIDGRMEKPTPVKGEVVIPFDHVRASVNLVVASILIACATSLKLPLSTTYVTFMVAMGSSFADGAWDRESAVYRISGVLMVISGWFITAASAFSMCAAVAVLVFAGGWVSVAALMLTTVGVIVYTNFIASHPEETSFDIVRQNRADRNAIRLRIGMAMSDNLDATINLYHEGLTAFLHEDARGLKQVKSDAISLSDEISRWRSDYYRMALQSGGDTDDDARHFYYRAFTNMKDVGKGLRRIINLASTHVANGHRVFGGALGANLMNIVDTIDELRPAFIEYAESGSMRESELSRRTADALMHINKLQLLFFKQIDANHLSLRGSELYLEFLQFARETISRYTVVSMLQHELSEICERSAKESSPIIEPAISSKVVGVPIGA